MATHCHTSEGIASDAPTEGDKFPFVEDKSGSDAPGSDCLECNICLDAAQDPVVTLCGHLYCWPCMYKWLRIGNASSEDSEQRHQCPVCKSKVSCSTLVPLYNQGQTMKSSLNNDRGLGIVIPHRPLGPARSPSAPRSTMDTMISRLTEQNGLYHPPHPPLLSSPTRYHPGSPDLSLSGTTTSIIHPLVGTFDEIVFGRLAGNSLTNRHARPNSYSVVWDRNSRMRRRAKEADKSMSRVCLFLLFCILLCLLLF